MILLCLLRSLVAAIFFFCFTMFWSALGVLEAFLIHKFEYETWIMQTWARVAIKVFNVQVEGRGLENIPSGSCLFLFNHTSFFDIFVMINAYPHFRFGAKIELFKIPFMGEAMRRFGVLPIARQRKEEVFKVYADAKIRALNGEKFALSPEGGRNTEETLLPFKSGPFLFAINSEMPLVPVIIRGAKDVLGKGQFLPNWNAWGRKVSVEYLKPIAVQGRHPETRLELQKQTFEAMRPFFEGSIS